MLKDARDRLGEMQAENRTVAAAFSMSYQDLSAEQQRLFRRLGLHPGREVDAYAVAALDNVNPTQARRGLEALYVDHLIDEPLPGRYRLHDLVRAYARTLASQDDPHTNDAAVDRLLDYYQCATTIANGHFARRSDFIIPLIVDRPAETPDLSTRHKSLVWLEAERGNLSACIDHAATHFRSSRAVSLAHGMHAFLDMVGYGDQAVAIHRSAHAAARLTSDQLGQATALDDLGTAHRQTGDHPAAIACLTEALTLFRHLGDRLGQAKALYDLGVVQRQIGDYMAATASLTKSLTLFRDLEDRLGQANALNEFSLVQSATGEYAAATGSLTEALTLFRDLNDHFGEADALYYLGVVQRMTGDYSSATASLNEVLTAYRALGHRRGQANALNDLGLVQCATGEYLAATVSLTEALTRFRELGSRNGQANALSDLGLVQYLTGEYPAATASMTEALAIYTGVGNRHGQAEAFNRLGALLLDSSAHDDAIVRHQHALRLAQEARIPVEEARALEGIGRCLIRTHASEGIAYLQQALTIYQRIGLPEAERVAATLTELRGSAELQGGV